jgi:hypothetical protein
MKMPQMSPNAILCWAAAITGIGIGLVAYQRWYEQQRHEHFVANVRYQIATHWHKDGAMKFAHIQSVTLSQTQPDWFHGEVVYKLGDYEKKLPLHVLMKDDKTEWTIDAPNRMPLKLETYGAFQVFYEWPITDQQAGKAIGWLDEQGHIGKETGAAFLHKAEAAFVLHMPMNDGIPADAEMVKLAEGIAKGLSADVFAGSPVKVHLCDRQLRSIEIVKSR